MPIDVSLVKGAELPPLEFSWDADRVILYHLGIGAGAELRYAYERELRVLPSYGVLPALGTLGALLRARGMDIQLTQVLHGEQRTTIHEPLPAAAEVVTTASVSEVWDKGSAAVIVVDAHTSTREGTALVSNRFSAFVRGEGGFGGEPGPGVAAQAPDRAPDHVVACPTTPWQGLLYRLSGDKNPLHADPEVAARAGFERPILHGLCTYGIACRAAIDTLLDGDVARVASYGARFAGIVYPGETIEVSLWRDGDEVAIAARALERDAPVLSNAGMTLLV
jgi:acyl dehydratase